MLDSVHHFCKNQTIYFPLLAFFLDSLELFFYMVAILVLASSTLATIVLKYVFLKIFTHQIEADVLYNTKEQREYFTIDPGRGSSFHQQFWGTS